MLGFPKGTLGERSWKGCKEAVRRLGTWKGKGGGRVPRRGRRVSLEGLEDRTLLATAGVDYVLSRYSWSNPSKITYSIAPDGVYWVSGVNAINSSLDARFGAGVWRREVARALATWQAVANINIVPVSDGPYDSNAAGKSQGDPRFGDIRIGATAFPGDSKTLAQTYYPPPQGATASGDVEINLGISYSIGGQYDLFSVVLHETGHSLGLGHPSNSSVVMRPIYGGTIEGLDDGDVAGIQAIYGPRQPDVYESRGYGASTSLPIDLTSTLVTSQTATASAASLDRIGEVQWFSFVAPSYASGSWQVTASASTSSMLSPKVSIYDDAGNLLGQASDPSKWSADVTAAMSSIVPGRRYYASVTGATDDVFAIGTYNLTVGMSRAPAPVAPPPSNPITANPIVTPPVATTPSAPPPSTPTGPIYSASFVLPDRFENNNSSGSATRLGRVTQATYSGLTLTSGDVDFYSFQPGAAGVVQVSAAGTTIQVLNPRGRVIAQGNGSVGVSVPRNASVLVMVRASGSSAVASYNLSISSTSPGRRRMPFARSLARQVAAPAPDAAYRIPAGPAWRSVLRTASA